VINFDDITDYVSTWKAVSISSTVLCINNVFLVVQTNWIINIIQLVIQLLISGATLLLVAIKIRNELKNKNKNEEI
jgi:hypothetical protein